ncbi:imelysin family protein [Plastorhodobacter daqingensis]|uniref:Imelysin family protein n=1 Tax=Plastorhodobacter daqingensis TaxID=1387281 RepID=A0ABW2UQ39_9RHOB
MFLCRPLALATTVALTMATPAAADDRMAVLSTYADIALAGYQDSFTTAQALDAAIAALIAAPSEGSLAAARAAWRAARIPYQQTEVFRFGNPVVDDWEGRVNAWPLDEGLIDYTAGDYIGAYDENPLADLNIIATPMLMVAGQQIDAREITPALLQSLNELDGIEANVTTGYHAIEFLLWGQDLNGTGPGAGDRPHTDFVQGAGCTGGNCDRRAAYLTAASALLIDDLSEMVAAWGDTGEARAAVLADPVAGLSAMLTGMGSLSYGELAGERMRLGLLLNDPEEEHDCFADNTHMSHFLNAQGIRNVWTGRLVRIDGSVVEGPSLAGLVATLDTAMSLDLTARIDATMVKMQALVDAAEDGMAYDMMLAPGNDAGAALIMTAIDGLIAQTRGIERAVTALGLGTIGIEGSDSLDDPASVLQ